MKQFVTLQVIFVTLDVFYLKNSTSTRSSTGQYSEVCKAVALIAYPLHECCPVLFEIPSRMIPRKE